MLPKPSSCKLPDLTAFTRLLTVAFFVTQLAFDTCHAQSPQTRVDIQLLGPDQGLPSRNIRCLTQDGRGFMWVGTGQDLWRYDGYTFQNQTDILTRSIGGRTLINQVKTSLKGEVWVAHNSGVSIINPDNLSCTTMNPNSNNREAASIQVLDIFFDKKQNPWLATQLGQLIQLDKQGAVTRRIDLMSGLSDGHLPVSGFLQVSADSLVVYYKQKGNTGGGMRSYSFTRQTFGPLKISKSAIPEVMHVDPRGYTWHKSDEAVGFLNRKTGEFTSLTGRLQQKSGANIYFFTSYLSSDGSFWIACVDGLFKITLTGEIFRKYLSVALEKPGDIGSSIRGITEESPGLIWVCSYGFNRDGKLYMLHQLDPVTGRRRHMELHRPRNIPGDQVIPYKVLFADKQVYAITDGTQFIRIDPANEEYYPVEFPFVSGRGFTAIYKLNEHTFWLGTWGGMGIIDTKNLKPVLLNDQTGKYIKNERVNHFLPWSGNRILVSTTNGIYILNRDATVQAHFGQNAGDKIKLPALQIYHSVWHENALWAGSSQGLMRIDTVRKVTQLFTIEDGLPDNTIYAALPDERGNLWLSTNKGISRFHTQTQTFQNYGLSDGLPHMEFNHGSYLKASDGTLYFGGLNGIVAINPARLDPGKQKKHPLQLIAYSKYDADRNKTDTLTNHKPGAPIHFSPGDRLFSFSFMSPDYQNTARNRFRYKLEGWDDESWHMFENGNKLLFNSLPPGQYNLRVQVSVAGANWSAEEWEAPLKVAAPWYKSPWFFAATILTLGAIFYLIYRYRLRQMMQIQQIRNGISADMHDEIGSTLSSITFYSQALLMQMDKAEHQQVVQKIKDNAQHVQEGLSDIIWSVKAGNDEIEDVFARMFHFGSGLADSKGIIFHFETDEKMQHIRLAMNTRKNLYLIFKEAVNNAAKYAECSELSVQVGYEASQIKMTIRDNGKGFDVPTARKGNGLANMQQRARQLNGKLSIQSAPGKGTEVAVTFKI